MTVLYREYSDSLFMTLFTSRTFVIRGFIFKCHCAVPTVSQTSHRVGFQMIQLPSTFHWPIMGDYILRLIC